MSREENRLVERAITIAVQAHAGQPDKAGKPYILHPLRVMAAMDTDEERIVAVLHDVVEDSDWSLDDLRAEGLSARMVAALGALTKRPGEEYAAFIERVARNALARRVKIADLEDNLKLGRIPHPTARDRLRMRQYETAHARLTGEAAPPLHRAR